MGEAKRKIQLAINSSRISWQTEIPELEKSIAILYKSLQSLTGHEMHYWDIEDRLEEKENALRRVLELSAMTDQELIQLFRKQGCFV